MKKRLIDFGLVTIGAFIAAVGFNCFFLENHIASGGVVGLAVSLKALFGWNPGNFVMITNVPLLLACLIFLGKETFLKTIYHSQEFTSTEWFGTSMSAHRILGL